MEAHNTEIGTGPTDNDLLSMAMKADGVEEIVVGEETEAQSPLATPAEESQNEGQPSEDKTSEEGSETKETEQEPSEEPAEESKYSKAKKEQERQDRSWKKLEEEKASLRAERERYEQERASISQEKARIRDYRDSSGYTAEDYEKFSRETDDPSLAEEATRRAQNLRGEEMQARSHAQREDFHKGWQNNLNALLEKDPELKNQDGELGQELRRILAERPVFSTSPDGIRHAYEFAKAKQSASLVSGLKDEVNQLRKENERLNKLTSPSSGGPTQKASLKSFAEMSSKEQERMLELAAAEADGIAY